LSEMYAMVKVLTDAAMKMGITKDWICFAQT
jgi:hypothetical protein